LKKSFKSLKNKNLFWKEEKKRAAFNGRYQSADAR
jgi:hypothetical protein